MDEAMPTDRPAEPAARHLPEAGEDMFAETGSPHAGQPPAVLRATDLSGVNLLKHDDLFLLTDAFGDIAVDRRGLGLYEGDTRFLSRYELRLNETRPVVLRTAGSAGYAGTIHLSNPDLWDEKETPNDPEIVLRRHSLGMVRERLLAGSFREHIRIDNFTTADERARIVIRLDADYADIFEVRGVERERRGERLANLAAGNRVSFAYRGTDDAVRRTHVSFSPPLEVSQPDGDRGEVVAHGAWQIPAGGRLTVEVHVWTELVEPVQEQEPSDDDGPEAGGPVPDEGPEAGAEPVPDEQQPAAMHRAWRNTTASVETSQLYTQRALDRGLADLRLLLNSGPDEGDRYIAAGVPWFCTLFGRDALITAMQLLSVRPQAAAETLSVLAAHQATEVDDWRDAEPGKILHELRRGEMARAGEIPHTPYYGTVDATPLWLMLLDEYQRWTADDELVDRLWPNALAALRWIEEYGDADGDGFVEYRRHSRRGLANQGWKDSSEAIRNRDGSPAEAPIALVEVQGYVYAARRGLARLAAIRGDRELAARQEVAAERLRVAFEEAFWMPDADTYALALDAGKRQVTALASNAGHALWCGLASPERAARVARRLTSPPMWSGWGIRTLAAGSVGYNPIGYHVGSVWPHDNAICAAGFSRYGLNDEARLVTGAMLEATAFFRDARLPELFCGFDRETSPFPVPYPVACSPQAWAAGAPFQAIAAALGMRPDAGRGLLELVAPALPDALPDLRIRNLALGKGLLDLSFKRSDGSVVVEVERRTGEANVVVRL